VCRIKRTIGSSRDTGFQPVRAAPEWTAIVGRPYFHTVSTGWKPVSRPEAAGTTCGGTR
jgi:hypothetical protein